MFTPSFLIAALERAVKTFAQTAAALWGGGTVTNIVDLNWGDIIGLSGSAAVLSVLTSVASIPLSTGNSPSLVPAAEVEAAGS